MGAFLYKAVDAGGRHARGLIEASSESAARAELRQRKLLPLSVEPTRRRPGQAFSRDRAPRSSRLGPKRLALLTRQLATLVGANVRIEDALRVVAGQTRSAREGSLLLNLRGAVLDGRSFAAALDDNPASFDEYYRASVRAGETSGRLSQVMDHLALHIEEQAKNRQSLQLALIYPALLTIVSVVVISALLAFVVPDIVRVFTSRGADLPGLTRALIAASDWLTTWGPVAAAVCAGGVATGLAALRRPRIRARWHWLLATTWPMRGPVLKIASARFSGTLATLVQSGVPLADALRAATDTVPNLYLRTRLAALAQRVSDGAALSRAAEESGIFPPMLVAMIASGEAGGTLGHSLERSAAEQSADLKAKVATIVALVEPGVLLVMGGIVMLLVLAILMPIVSLNDLTG
ncbi:Type II secretion system protein F [Roseivivax jejudonensis]|uniref:Type II secretion system protein F n=1 Tax=Roseivivax jejudonensis TaxID=1529041 RepID=A0A1X6Y7I1_9RHOB|nr:type II secretion system F family protein [Roseivivax jejudonensis]SLN13061.1 Type II secretion system protein F [Roseivivax jejudonensis]